MQQAYQKYVNKLLRKDSNNILIAGMAKMVRKISYFWNRLSNAHLSELKSEIVSKAIEIFKKLKTQKISTPSLLSLFEYIVDQVCPSQNNDREELSLQQVIIKTTALSEQALNDQTQSCCPNCSTSLIKNQQLPLVTGFCCPEVYALVNMNNLYEDDLTAAICVLANKNAGSIIITKKHSKNTIVQGISSLSEQQEKKINSIIRSSLHRIVHHEHIKVKLEPVTLRQRFNFYPDQNSQEFVLRLSISVLVCLRDHHFFHTHHKVKNFKSTYQYYRLKKHSNGALPLSESIRQVSSNQIYLLMQEKVRQTMNKKYPILSNLETKLMLQPFMVSTDISACVSSKPMQEKKEYKIVLDNQLLCRCCKIFNESSFERYFRPISQKQSVMLLSINLNYGLAEAIRKADKFFQKYKIKNEILIPMQDFQEFLNKQRTKGSQTYVAFMLCPIIFEGNLKQCIHSMKQTFSKENLGYVIFEPITEKIELAGYMNQIQIDCINTLTFNKFAEFPISKKVLFNVQNNINVYRKVEFSFRRVDLNIALYIYMLLQLSKKRPKCQI